MSIIDEQISSYDFSEMIVNFLLTYEKDKMIKFFISRTENLKVEIELSLQNGISEFSES